MLINRLQFPIEEVLITKITMTANEQRPNDTLMIYCFFYGLFMAPEAFDMRTVCHFSEAFDCTRGP